MLNVAKLDVTIYHIAGSMDFGNWDSRFFPFIATMCDLIAGTITKSF